MILVHENRSDEFNTHQHVLELETIHTRVLQVCTLTSLSLAAEADSGGYKVRVIKNKFKKKKKKRC